MGQRSQFILITPKVYYNDNNPNNNAGGIYAYHNQWRYGDGAIIVLADVLRKLEFIVKEEKARNKKDNAFFINSLCDNFWSCIKYAENHKIDWEMSQSQVGRELTKELLEAEEIFGFLHKYTDNNNGWFFIKLDENLKITFGILNGAEESDEIIKRTPQEYCDFFDFKQDTQQPSYLEDAFKYLKKFKSLSPFEELRELRGNLLIEERKSKEVQNEE